MVGYGGGSSEIECSTALNWTTNCAAGSLCHVIAVLKGSVVEKYYTLHGINDNYFRDNRAIDGMRSSVAIQAEREMWILLLGGARLKGFAT